VWKKTRWQHAIGMRFFKGLEQDSLILVAQPSHVGKHRHARAADSRLEIQESLQRKFVELWRLVRQETDLVDR
jgi:hypothetical protein